MNAPCVFSACVDRAGFAAAARALAMELGADCLLAGGLGPAWEQSLAAVLPEAELAVTAATGRHELAAFASSGPGPCLGFLGYPCGLALRGVASHKAPAFPWGCLRRYRAVVSHDPAAGMLACRTADAALAREIRRIVERRCGPPPRRFCAKGLRVSLDRQGYEAAVAEALRRIRRGDVYQLNLSMAFGLEAPGLDPAALFFDLYRRRPAGFYGLYRMGPHALVSTSPERFLRVRDGQVLSQPIKGTARVGADLQAARERLLNSAKEAAELSMIVDLMRNDISSHCEYGSVAVADHRSVFQVDDLLQAYSSVTGRLRAGSHCLDLLLDAMPAGSVTGCPKIEALSIIDELEPHCREAYCGAMLLVHGPRDMDSSVLIRTALWEEGRQRLDFHAGSGIVVDSDPAAEYLETMAKAEKFLDLEAR